MLATTAEIIATMKVAFKAFKRKHSGGFYNFKYWPAIRGISYHKPAIPEAVTQGCSIKGMPLKILQNSLGKHLCWSLFVNKVADWKTETFFKDRLWHESVHVRLEK